MFSEPPAMDDWAFEPDGVESAPSREPSRSEARPVAAGDVAAPTQMDQSPLRERPAARGRAQDPPVDRMERTPPRARPAQPLTSPESAPRRLSERVAGYIPAGSGRGPAPSTHSGSSQHDLPVANSAAARGLPASENLTLCQAWQWPFPERVRRPSQSGKRWSRAPRC